MIKTYEDFANLWVSLRKTNNNDNLLAACLHGKFPKAKMCSKSSYLKKVPTASKKVVATQANMETGTATDLLVSPGRQHFHPGHPKCWAMVTVSAGTPTLQSSYNITSITDTATGQLTVTIATDFSSANWCCDLMTEAANTYAADGHSAAAYGRNIDNTSIAAGSVLLESWVISTDVNGAVSSLSLTDPISWHMIGLGDQT